MSGIQSRIPTSSEHAKSAAKQIKSRLAELGVTVSTGHAYETLAASLGFANWSTMKAALDRTPVREEASYERNKPIVALEIKIRDAIKKLTHQRSNKYLEGEIQEAISGAIQEAIKQEDSFKELLDAAYDPANWDDIYSQQSFKIAFALQLHQEIVTKTRDAIIKALKIDVQGRLALTLRDVERRLVWIDSLSKQEARSFSYALGDGEITQSEFQKASLKVIQQYSFLCNKPEMDSYPLQQDKDLDLMIKLDSIDKLIKHEPRQAYHMFIEEREQLLDPWEVKFSDL